MPQAFVTLFCEAIKAVLRTLSGVRFCSPGKRSATGEWRSNYAKMALQIASPTCCVEALPSCPEFSVRRRSSAQSPPECHRERRGSAHRRCRGNRASSPRPKRWRSGWRYFYRKYPAPTREPVRTATEIALRIEIGRRRNADSAGTGRAEIGENIAEQVGADHHVKTLRLQHEAGTGYRYAACPSEFRDSFWPSLPPAHPSRAC